MTTTRAQSAEIKRMMDSLDEREKTLVKVQTAILRDFFSEEIQSLKEALELKDRKIKQLNDKCDKLEKKVSDLEEQVEELSQYGRRETIVISGPDTIPAETTGENTTDIVCNLIKSKLSINIKSSDISVSHRLGRPKSSSASASASPAIDIVQNRPIIVKLVNRSLKHDLIAACVLKKPKLFINESLTPQRLALFRQVLWVRKEHKNAFKSCYTSEGKIVIRLKNSNQEYVVTSESSLINFLDRYPNMKETYLKNNNK